MKILFTSDIHIHPNHLFALVHKTLIIRPEVLIIGGDIIPHLLPGNQNIEIINAQAKYIKKTLIPELRYLKSQMTVDIFIDMGNDDLSASRHLLQAHEGKTFQLLHMQRHRLSKHVDIIGYMVVPPTPFLRKDWEKPDTQNCPYAAGSQVQIEGYTTASGQKETVFLDFSTSETIENDLNLLSAKIVRPFIFVSHSPPYGTPLDQIAGGIHVGSISIRRFIEHWSRQGLLIASFHGHIHESPRISGYTRTAIHRTQCFNPGQQEEKLQFLELELVENQGKDKLKIIAS